MTIAAVDVGHYRIPLPVVLSDSTHGEIAHFELVTARVRTADGAEGLGYTYTVGAGAAAIRALLDGARAAPRRAGPRADRGALAADVVGLPLRRARRPGGVRDLGGRHRALGPPGAPGAGFPCGSSSEATIRGCKAYAGGIDLQFPLDRLLRQTDENLGRGFRAIKMKVGRPGSREDVERVRAMREQLGPDVPLDGRRQHALDGRRGDPGRARARRPRGVLARGADDSRRRARTRAGRPGGRRSRSPPGENLRTIHEFSALIDAGGVTFPEPDVSNVRRRHGLAQGRPPRRGPQPPRHLARRARPPRPSPGRGAERLVPRGPRLRPRAVHGPPARHPGRRGHAPRTAPVTASSSTGRVSKRSALADRSGAALPPRCRRSQPGVSGRLPAMPASAHRSGRRESLACRAAFRRCPSRRRPRPACLAPSVRARLQPASVWHVARVDRVIRLNMAVV